MRLSLLAPLLALAACPRPPVGPPDAEPPPAGRVGPLALETFTQDRPAIAGKWFEYDPSNHALTPKEHAWIVRDVAADPPSDPPSGALERHVAFRIASIYETEVAESGLFTFGVAVHDGTAWGPEEEWVTSRNVKTTGPMCVNLFDRTELACDDDGDWQLRLAIFDYFSPLAGIAVAEPGVFVHSPRVQAARVDGVTSLAALPDPAALVPLADAPPPGWESTDWSFDALAPDLPEAGMAVGARFLDGPDDVYWLLGARFDLVRFTVAPVDAADLARGLRFTFASAAADRADWSAPEVMPAPTSVDVPLPALGTGTWLTFTTADLALSSENLVDTAWPHAPPKTSRFDLAIERVLAGGEGGDEEEVRLLVSPAACIKNATQLGLDENVPPVSTP